MRIGKVLCILAGILTLVSTFFLSLFSIVPSAYLWLEANTAYGSGLGFFLHIADIFTNIDTLAADYGVGSYLIYIFAGMLILWGISGILQLLGLKSRGAIIVGSLMPLFIGIILILTAFMTLPSFFDVFTLLFTDNTQLGGFMPFDLPLGDFSLGVYLLLAGGALGLIGGIIGPE